MKLNLSIKELTLIGMCAALMAIFSQISLPLPFTTVPLTFQTFGVVLIAIVLEHRISTISMIVWVFLGIVGIPVFSGFSGGVGVIFGPTGGYIIGFIFMSFIVGYAASRKNKMILFIGVYIGQAIQYILGTIQLKSFMGLTLKGALVAGVYPFVLKDIIVITVAVSMGLMAKNTLKRGLI